MYKLFYIFRQLRVLTTRLSSYDQEMSDLREFYDPDTVDLMQWLEQQTARESVVSGSMQLMAGVKLCSGRAVTNHPHFEDQQLRDRTKYDGDSFPLLS